MMNSEMHDGELERLFIAVKLPSELQVIVGRKCNRLSQELHFSKWTHPDDYHITLQFLGDTDKEDIPAIIKALKEVGRECMPFQLSLEDFGTFGVPASPRVLWAGVSGELEKLHQLQQAVVSATLPLGYTAEKRDYKPHLTLARKYRGNTPFDAKIIESLLKLDVDLRPKFDTIDWTVDSFVLYSTRMYAIPMYEIIENITFL